MLWLLSHWALPVVLGGLSPSSWLVALALCSGLVLDERWLAFTLAFLLSRAAWGHWWRARAEEARPVSNVNSKGKGKQRRDRSLLRGCGHLSRDSLHLAVFCVSALCIDLALVRVGGMPGVLRDSGWALLRAGLWAAGPLLWMAEADLLLEVTMRVSRWLLRPVLQGNGDDESSWAARLAAGVVLCLAGLCCAAGAKVLWGGAGPWGWGLVAGVGSVALLLFLLVLRAPTSNVLDAAMVFLLACRVGKTLVAIGWRLTSPWELFVSLFSVPFPAPEAASMARGWRPSASLLTGLLRSVGSGVTALQSAWEWGWHPASPLYDYACDILEGWTTRGGGGGSELAGLMPGSLRSAQRRKVMMDWMSGMRAFDQARVLVYALALGVAVWAAAGSALREWAKLRSQQEESEQEEEEETEKGEEKVHEEHLDNTSVEVHRFMQLGAVCVGAWHVCARLLLLLDRTEEQGDMWNDMPLRSTTSYVLVCKSLGFAWYMMHLHVLLQDEDEEDSDDE